MLFVGVNCHGKSFVLMGAFLPREDVASFRFALQSFVKMGFKQPTVCLSDQDTALVEAIKLEWKETQHIFCLFHIFRNVQKHAAHLLKQKNTEFLKEFSILQRRETIDEFEDNWKMLLKKYCDEEEKAPENFIREIEIDYSYESSDSENDDDSDQDESDAQDRIQTSQASNNSQKKSDKKVLKEYLQTLYARKISWARCYTFRHFAAGIFIIIFSL